MKNSPNNNTESQRVHDSFPSLNQLIMRHINILQSCVSEQEKSFFDDILQSFQKNHIFNEQDINHIYNIIDECPIFQYFILPIILDYKNNDIKQLKSTLTNIVRYEDFYGKNFDTQTLCYKDIFDFFDHYIGNNFTEQELDELYKNDYETFIRMYYGYTNKWEAPVSYLHEIMWFPPSYQRTQEKYGLTKEEQEIFGYIYRYKKFRILQNPNAIFHRILLKNFVKKLPKYQWKVYRWISFSKKELYDQFIQNPSASLEQNIQNFSTKSSTPHNFSKWKHSVFIEIDTSKAHYLGNILYDTEDHAWFAQWTKFEMIHIHEWSPTHIILKVQWENL